MGRRSPRDTSRGDPHIEEVDMELLQLLLLSPDRLSGGEGGAPYRLSSGRLTSPLVKPARPKSPIADCFCCWCC